jgi:hypothetical protein
VDSPVVGRSGRRVGVPQLYRHHLALSLGAAGVLDVVGGAGNRRI